MIIEFQDEYEVVISAFCESLCEKMINKYRKGKCEHGGKPYRLDCKKEVNLEVLDILNYFVIDKVNKNYPKKEKKLVK